jgi:hypothetical protein
VRQNWDYERDQGPPKVQLVKLYHEKHIAYPGLLGAGVLFLLLRSVDAPEVRTIIAVSGTFGTAFAIFFNTWWCATVSDVDSD